IKGLAEGDEHAGLVLQLQGDVLDDMAEVRTAVQPLEESAGLPGRAMVLAQPGQAFEQTIDEAKHFAALAAGQLVQLDAGAEDGPVEVDVRARQGADAFKPHGSSPRSVCLKGSDPF